MLVCQRQQLQHLFLVLAGECLLYRVLYFALAQEQAVDLVGPYLAEDAGSEGQVVVLADDHLCEDLELSVLGEAVGVFFGDRVLLSLELPQSVHSAPPVALLQLVGEGAQDLSVVATDQLLDILQRWLL